MKIDRIYQLVRRIRNDYYYHKYLRNGNIFRFQKIAEFYRGDGHYFYLHGELPDENYLYTRTGLSLDNWTDNRRAIEMLRMYWIEDEEYESHWRTLQEEVYNDLSINEMTKTPEKVFSSRWITKGFEGGQIIENEEEYECLRESLIDLGETDLIIIENNPPEGPFPIKLHLPLSMTWNDILRGGYLLLSILLQDYGNFYVYGSIPKWGMFVATESERMMKLISYSSEKAVFFNSYEQHMLGQ